MVKEGREFVPISTCPKCGLTNKDIPENDIFSLCQCKKVTITFDGARCSGKTYFAKKIQDFLNSEGFDTEYIPPEMKKEEMLIVINKFDYKSGAE